MEVKQMTIRGKLVKCNDVLLVLEDGRVIGLRSNLPSDFDCKQVEITIKEIG